MSSEPIYRTLAQLVDARTRCRRDNKGEWAIKHTDRIRALVRAHMPRGSGIDNGTTIDLDKSTAESLVFDTSFHHMDEHGSYDGWTEHRVTVRASLAFGLDIKIGGRDRNQIKEYLHEVFRDALTESTVEVAA